MSSAWQVLKLFGVRFVATKRDIFHDSLEAFAARGATLSSDNQFPWTVGIMIC